MASEELAGWVIGRGCLAAIFDLDGVVVNTAPYHYLTWKRVAAGLGFDFTLQDNERIKGATRLQSLEIVLAAGGLALSEAEKARLVEQTRAEYLQHIHTLTEADQLPGVAGFIRRLRAQGIRIGLGSASQQARLILAQIKLAGLFDAVVDGKNGLKPKPDPQVFLHAAHLLGVAPAACVVFEDAQAGLLAARAAGMLAVGVGRTADLPAADCIIPGFE